MNELREIRDHIFDNRTLFSETLTTELEGNNKKRKGLIEYICLSTKKKESTVRTLLSDGKINDKLMQLIEKFIYGRSE